VLLLREVRFLIVPNTTASEFLAGFMSMMVLRAFGKIPDTLAVYDFNKYALSIGSFQDIDTEVDMDACKKNGIEVNRRPRVGGGTIFLDPSSHMLQALIIDKNAFKDMDDSFRKIGETLAKLYQELGVSDAFYKHIGDIKVGDKKITGFGPAVIGEALGEMAILGIGKVNTELMKKIVKVPPEKFSDKKAKKVEDYVTTVEDETGRKPTKEDVRGTVKRIFEEELGLKAVPGKLTDEEKQQIEQNSKAVMSEDHLYSFSSSRRFKKIPKGSSLGFGRYKARKLLVAHTLMNRQGQIEDIMISGDFYCKPPEYLHDLEISLKGVEANNSESIMGKINDLFAKPNWEIPEVNPEDFLKVISKAVEKK
jgi:lipoate-protein ligase A